MKETIVKGRSLTEKELKDVKGGTYYPLYNVTNPPPKPFLCDVCDHEVYLFLYDGDSGLFTAICENCGCRKEVKVEE